MSNIWLVFVLGTILCWGAYGPTLHRGQVALGNDPWKAILCVGGAYFVLAVIIPVAILKLQGQTLQMTGSGTTIASIAGVLGALGAICIAAAIKTGGKSVTFMPLVFGCAPVVNVAVSAWLHPPHEKIQPLFYVGILVVAVGAGMVLYFRPMA